MNKQIFKAILKCALLHFEGACFVELVNDYGYRQEVAEAGINICDHIKNTELNKIKGDKK